MDIKQKKYIGDIAIIGKPNVGKSSLLNKIFNEKISIVNAKPQTTRNKIENSFINEKYNITFIDTPGYHKEKNKLDSFLNKEVKLALKNVNLIYFLCDPTRAIDEEDIKLLTMIKNLGLPIFLIITKKDLIHKNNINEIINSLNHVTEFQEIIFISINDEDSILKLFKYTEKYLEYTNEILDNTNKNTIQSDLFLVKEIIREQCLLLLRQELPYGVAVLIDLFEYNKNKNEFIINASINVEKESQKKIVIGLNGSMIKQISMNSRQELLKIYDSKIFLKIFVKVSKNWRDDEVKLKEFGYSY